MQTELNVCGWHEVSMLCARHAANLRIRHLYHDREEFTIVGERA